MSNSLEICAKTCRHIRLPLFIQSVKIVEICMHLSLHDKKQSRGGNLQSFIYWWGEGEWWHDDEARLFICCDSRAKPRLCCVITVIFFILLLRLLQSIEHFLISSCFVIFIILIGVHRRKCMYTTTWETDTWWLWSRGEREALYGA